MSNYTLWCYNRLIKERHVKKVNFLLNKGLTEINKDSIVYTY